MEDGAINRNNMLCVAFAAAIAIMIAAGLFNRLGLLDTQFDLIVPLALGLVLMVMILTYALLMSTRRRYHEFASPLEGASYDPRDARSRGHYIIPFYCPHCKDRIDLQRIHWIDAITLVCQNCMGKIKAEESGEGFGI